MSTKPARGGLRQSASSQRYIKSLTSAQFSAYIAGQAQANRSRCLMTARLMQDRGVRSLYVAFARDHHREYLREMRKVWVPA